MVFSKNSAFPFFPHNFPARLTELQKGQKTSSEDKPWVSSTASTESNPFLSSSPTTRQHTIAFIDQRALMRSALAVVYASMSLWTRLVYTSMSLWKSVTFHQHFIWYVADSRPWVPLFSYLMSYLCISLSAHWSQCSCATWEVVCTVLLRGWTTAFLLNLWVLRPPTRFQLPFLYSQEEGKGPIILFCSSMKLRFGKCSKIITR